VEPPLLGKRIHELDALEIELVRSPQRQLECQHLVELALAGQPKRLIRRATQVGRKMLNDGAIGKVAQRTALDAVTRPARALDEIARSTIRGVALDAGRQRKQVRHRAHHELVVVVLEAVDIFLDEPTITERRGLETREVELVALVDEQWVGRVERVHEGQIDGEVVPSGMAGTAGAPISRKLLVEKHLRTRAHIERYQPRPDAWVEVAPVFGLGQRRALLPNRFPDPYARRLIDGP